MRHRLQDTLHERLVTMLKAGPMERHQIDARLGSRASAANAIDKAQRASEIERVPGMHSEWQLKSDVPA